jgi:6-phospho-beta-glucosidase
MIGGGGFRVPLIHRALAAAATPIDQVTLFDPEPSRVAVIRSVLGDTPPAMVATSLDEAIGAADVVFCAARVGGTAGRVADERRAVQRGLVGQETVGAGGIAFALRTIPAALDLAERVSTLAPRAWVVNFTNPAGIVTEAMRTVLGDRVIGICDSPSGLVRRVCLTLNLGERQVTADYAGINHLGWLRRLSTADGDLLPALLADAARVASFEEGRLFGPDLLRALGAIPNEYLIFYYGAADVAAAERSGPTRGEVVRAEQQQFYERAAADPGQAAALWELTRRRREESYLAEARRTERDVTDLTSGGYEQIAVDLLDALSGQGERTLILNVANAGSLPELPDDVVVEIPCRVGPAGATPVPVGPLDLHQLGLVASVRASERAALTAIVHGSRDEALRAFAINPLVPSIASARDLLAGTLADAPALTGRLR